MLNPKFVLVVGLFRFFLKYRNLELWLQLFVDLQAELAGGSFQSKRKDLKLTQRAKNAATLHVWLKLLTSCCGRCNGLLLDAY